MMREKPLALPVGIDNFREIRDEEYYYIDKTMMIQDFLTFRDKVSLITRPRRFGKTLNMTMLRDFFDIEQNSEAIFSGLAIKKTKYASQLNTRPVIYLTFKGCSGKDIEHLKVSLAMVMKDEYFKHQEILSNSKRVDWKSNQYYEFHQIYQAFKELVAKINGDKKIDDTILKRSLLVLTRTLSIFYDQKPILLIDEYDQPLINAHDEKFREQFSKRIYTDFLGNALKGSDYLHQALLTGIQRVAKESVFSKLNNFSVYTVADKQYATYFGLTEKEAKQALADHELTHNEEVRQYYDGYRIGGYSLYNPWSILNYLNKKKLEPYWVNTSTNVLIRELIPNADREFHGEFEELIVDKEVVVNANLDASFIELETTETLWGLLVNAGYLTIIEDFGGQDFLLRIPNQEVRNEFRKIVANYTGVGDSRLSQIFNALSRADMNRFLKLYQKFVYDLVSYHDVKQAKLKNKKPYHLENNYHMLFLGMAASVEGMYKLTSNLETGDGRSDVILESLQPTLRPHIVIEFEQGEDVATLKQKGLNQIIEKRYYRKLKGRVLCVGIAHNMKQCELVHQEIIVDEFGEFVNKANFVPQNQ